MIELVRVDVERDARTRMTELAGRADRIDASPDQVARERMPEIVEPELGHTVAVEARGLCRLTDSDLERLDAIAGFLEARADGPPSARFLGERLSPLRRRSVGTSSR